MKKMPIYILLLLITACNKSNGPIDTSIPICVQEILDNVELSKDIRTVRVQELDNELHYWLNTDFVRFDGVEAIVNMNCDTICSFCGFCAPAKCSSEYDEEEWITIWEK